MKWNSVAAHKSTRELCTPEHAFGRSVGARTGPASVVAARRICGTSTIRPTSSCSNGCRCWPLCPRRPSPGCNLLYGDGPRPRVCRQLRGGCGSPPVPVPVRVRLALQRCWHGMTGPDAGLVGIMACSTAWSRRGCHPNCSLRSRRCEHGTRETGSTPSLRQC